jgi:hypothetical protein
MAQAILRQPERRVECDPAPSPRAARTRSLTIRNARYSQPPSLLLNSQPFLPWTSTIDIAGSTDFGGISTECRPRCWPASFALEPMFSRFTRDLAGGGYAAVEDRSIVIPPKPRVNG